jgi:hypothetical protein
MGTIRFMRKPKSNSFHYEGASPSGITISMSNGLDAGPIARRQVRKIAWLRSSSQSWVIDARM